MNILNIKDLEKKFHKMTAVNGISLQVEEGEIFGLLGPNGAGKSTTINMISGLLKPTKGEIKLFEKDILLKEVKKNIGIVPQDIAIYAELTALENVMFFGGLYGLKGRELKENSLEALEFVGLIDRKDMTPSKFSGGMKRRLNIACALAHKPKLVIMDEPTVGIDPQSRNHILESIKSLNENGTTIIYTSHYMEEVESICSRIAIMDTGDIIAMGTKEQLKDEFSEDEIINITLKSGEVVMEDIFQGLKEIKNIKILGSRIELILVKDENNMENVIKMLMKEEVTIINVEKVQMDLETVFLNLTGRSLRD